MRRTNMKILIITVITIYTITCFYFIHEGLSAYKEAKNSFKNSNNFDFQIMRAIFSFSSAIITLLVLLAFYLFAIQL